MPETVTVACKHPHGLILRLFKMADVQEPLPGGGTKTVQRAQPLPQQITIRGYAQKYDPALPPAAKGSKFALTEGVDKEFFEEWLRQNHDHHMVVNKLIWSYANAKGEGANDRRNLKAKAGELRDVKCGLEPIDPKSLKGRLTTADEQQFPALQDEDA
jgi:hypothetical protein